VSPNPKILGEIRIPQENVNDDVVIIASWRVAPGAAVRAQDVVVEIETSKAVIELEAEVDGFLQVLHPEGAEVPVGDLIAHVVATADAGAAAPAEPLPQQSTPAGAGGGEVAISKKAQRLIDEHGIDPSVFAGTGLVKEVDVIHHLESRVAEREVSPASPESAPPTDVALPAKELPSKGAASHGSGPTQSSHAPGGLFGDAATAAADRGQSIWQLALNYLWRNWLLGNLVKVAPRGVILVLHRLRGVKMGADCFIDPSATLETAYPENITLGDDVRVTVGAIIMTHIKAPNYLRETGLVPAVLSPVVLEDHSFIGVNAVIMPGVRVGRASVVASGAVVVSNVPPYTMVAGNPAKIVKRFPKPE
jgi:acetyltransferase-like isoleucine patch superfamily enzyme